MRIRKHNSVLYEETGGRRVNRYTWQMFFPIILAVFLITIISGAEVSPEVLRLRLFLYGGACLSYLFAMSRQTSTKTAVYRLTDEGVYVRQLDKAYGIDVEYKVDYSQILWVGAFSDSATLRRLRARYALSHINRRRLRDNEALSGGRVYSWNGMAMIFEINGEVMTQHLEVSSAFLLQLERQMSIRASLDM